MTYTRCQCLFHCHTDRDVTYFTFIGANWSAPGTLGPAKHIPSNEHHQRDGWSTGMPHQHPESHHKLVLCLAESGFTISPIPSLIYARSSSLCAMLWAQLQLICINWVSCLTFLNNCWYSGPFRCLCLTQSLAIHIKMLTPRLSRHCKIYGTFIYSIHL